MRFPTPIVVLALGVLTLALGPATASARGLNRAESRIVQLLNDIRADHGLPSFAVSRALSRASRRHSGEMIDGPYS